MDCSTPGLPIHHQLLELTQTLVHWVSDAIQPSHPLSSPSPPAPSPSQHQSLFQWVNSSHEVAKVLEFQLYFFNINLFILIGGKLLYNIVVVLPYININPPWGYTCSPSWSPSHLPPHMIPLGRPSAPVLSILYHAWNLDLRFISRMIICEW